MGRDGQQLLPGFLENVGQHGTAGDEAPAAGSAAAMGQDVGVAMQHPDVGRGDAKLVGGHLGEDSLRSLAVG